MPLAESRSFNATIPVAERELIQLFKIRTILPGELLLEEWVGVDHSPVFLSSTIQRDFVNPWVLCEGGELIAWWFPQLPPKEQVVGELVSPTSFLGGLGIEGSNNL